jgi:hypothetical protein
MGEEAALARQLLDVLAAQMERDNMELIDQVLKAAARDPRQFKDLLQNLSKLIENGEIPHLLEIMRKTMEPAA